MSCTIQIMGKEFKTWTVPNMPFNAENYGKSSMSNDDEEGNR